MQSATGSPVAGDWMDFQFSLDGSVTGTIYQESLTQDGITVVDTVTMFIRLAASAGTHSVNVVMKSNFGSFWDMVPPAVMTLQAVTV
jgi:hypothetical protein